MLGKATHKSDKHNFKDRRLPVSAIFLIAGSDIRFRPGRYLAAAISLGFASSFFLLAMLSLQSTHQTLARLPKSLLTENELFIAATDPISPFLTNVILDSIRADPRVLSLDQRWRVRAFDLPAAPDGSLDDDEFYLGPMLGWIPGKRTELVACEQGATRGELSSGEWPSEDESRFIEVVVPEYLSWSIKLGDLRRLESDAGVFKAKVVGFLRMGEDFAATESAVRLRPWFLTKASATKVAGGEIQPSEAIIGFANANDRAAFESDFASMLNFSSSRIQLWNQDVIAKEAQGIMAVSNSRMAVRLALILTAACVICIAIGTQWSELDERKQQSAILRSLGAEPSTIRGILILHSMIVAFGGLIVAMVLALLITNALPFIGISSLADAKSIIATACVLFFGVLAGRMTTLRSAEELNQPSLFYQHHWRIYLGVSTTVSAITMVYAFSEARTMLRSTLLAWIAFPALVIVVVTLSPLIVRGICKIIQTPVAWITKTHPFVLDDHARANERRMNGSVLAISVGLSAFIWMICWAASLLDSFMIDPRMPRWMVSVYPYGVDQVETEKVLATPKYKKMEPLVLVDTRMAHRSPDLTLARLESGSKSRRGRVPEPNIGDRESSVKYKEVSDRTSLTPTLVFGVRPAYARDELPIQFLQGDANSAFTTLTDEDACLIDSWYAESHDVNVGDAISIAVPGKSLSDSSAVAVYTVHGVVEMKGWLMATKQNKTRLSSRPHEALVMLNIDRVRQDFGTAHANYFIGDPTIDESGKLSDYPSNVSLRAGIEASMKDRIAMSNAIRKTIDLNRSLPHSVDNGRVITINERSVQTDDLDRVRDALNGSWGAATVKRLSWLPLIFLAFSLMSVTGSLVAAMQSRSRELGILRSLGMSRLGIARLTLAESLLQGFSAIVLSSIIGLGGAWIMLQVARIAGFNLRWQGINADLRIHWSWLWPGWLVTLIICIFASIVAAWRFSRMSPAKLFTTGTTDKA